MKNTPSEFMRDEIQQTKISIQKRGYAHSEEIDILWESTHNIGSKLRWKKLMVTALIFSSCFILLSKLLHHS